VKRNLILGVLVTAVLMLGAATYAQADTATVYGVGGTATDTVTVKATINPKLTLTVDTPAATQTVNFGTLDPGDFSGPQLVTLTVQSNKTYDISVAKSGDTTIGLSTTLGDSSTNARTAGQAYIDRYSLSVPWTTSPGSYTATVQYTVTQN
jgi:hypothetical protein